jgi:carbon monoxide dehydrogenase subunit G
MHYSRTIEVPRTPAETFAYLADFENAAEWDPGVVEATRAGDGPTAVGSRFELIALFRGKRVPFRYVVTAYEPGARIALRGDGDKAWSNDEIRVGAAGAGASVAYTAELGLKGVYRLAAPLMARLFRRMGDDALDNLVRVLSAGR